MGGPKKFRTEGVGNKRPGTSCVVSRRMLYYHKAVSLYGVPGIDWASFKKNRMEDLFEPK
jgi:hypothetical protein